MIEPAGTSWPSPAFTPSRCPTLSRPFLTLPPAFLWAIAYLSFGAAFLVVLSSAAEALAAGFFGAPLAAVAFGSSLAAVAFGFAVEDFVGFAWAGAVLASLAARAASTTAC